MTPPRGFQRSEFEARVAKAQRLMTSNGLDALLLTTEPEVRYFTGYLTRFWESPTRPWFLVVPQSGKPIAIIPSIGADLMCSTWIDDVRTWSSPDLADDGVSLLSQALVELAGPKGNAGLPMSHETHLRMPLVDYHRLGANVAPITLRDDAGIMRSLRLIKSPSEIEKIQQACSIAGNAFQTVPKFAHPGTALEDVFREFQISCLQQGADWVSYLAGGAGPDGYTDVISPATQTPLDSGDILMLDTGLVWDGYFCDFDRNFAIGKPSAIASDAHQKLLEAVNEAAQIAKPGVSASDLFHVMNRILTGGESISEAGRLGHGLGMQLTEWPSLIPGDHTVLQEGMVLTLEPGIETRHGRMMVHEENIVITADGVEFLSPLAGSALDICGEP